MEENPTSEIALMRQALSLGASVRQMTPPNPWVGAVVLSQDGKRTYEGATEPPGGRHGEIVALEAAKADARGGTLFVTLEPCSHHGRTPPCVEAIINAGLVRVVVGVQDPDDRVNGSGIEQLRDAGIEVNLGVAHEEVEENLAAYLHHRKTGRPRVIVKLASTLDGQTAAHDGSSRWITGELARQDVAMLRASCDAILVGAGTIRRDDPKLTARTESEPFRQPLRVVLGEIPQGANVLPARSMHGALSDILDDLGSEGILQVLVEGGAQVAHDFITEGLVDRFVLYLAPAFMGGNDGSAVLNGPGAASIQQALRGRFVNVARIGDDLRVEVEI